MLAGCEESRCNEHSLIRYALPPAHKAQTPNVLSATAAVAVAAPHDAGVPDPRSSQVPVRMIKLR